MRVLDMDMAESDGQAKAILFNGTNPRDENENLLIRYSPDTGVEEEIGKLDASKNNSMVYLDGKLSDGTWLHLWNPW